MRLKKVELLIDTTTEAPFLGACSLIHHYMKRSFESLNYKVSEHLAGYSAYPYRSTPLSHAELISNLRSSKNCFRVSSVRCLEIAQPEKIEGVKNIIFIHGLGYNSSLYLQNHAVDTICADSEYEKSAFLSLFMFPSDFIHFNLSHTPSCVINSAPHFSPVLEFPKGYVTPGNLIPQEIKKKILSKKFRIGHALRPIKMDARSFISILHHLNLNQKKGDKRYLVALIKDDYDQVAQFAKKMPLDFKMEDHFISIPDLLKNSELNFLMRNSDFGLCYDIFPEPFGLYPVESISCMSPIFTNGVGNLRHLFPANHGVSVYETEEMYFGTEKSKLQAFKLVADHIRRSVESGEGKKQCQAGRKYINENYTFDTFKDHLEKMLKDTEFPSRVPKLKFSECKFQLSPLVRSWNSENGRIISDYLHQQLPAEFNELLKSVLGKTPTSVPLAKRKKSEAMFKDLFSTGVLSLAPKRSGAIRT